MSSPTHDVIGVTAAVIGLGALTDQTLDPTGLLVALVCMTLLGIAECLATQRQRAEEKRRKPKRDAIKAAMMGRGTPRKGATAIAYLDVPAVWWNGPSKKLRRMVRLVAYGGAALTAWPLGLAMASSRIPDQAEVGPIDHRGPTHYLLTAAVALGGLYVALVSFPETTEYAPWATGSVAAGWLVGHLAADASTLDGVPAFWPFYRKDVHLLPRALRVRTGSVVDTGILLACAVLTAWLGLGMAPAGWTIPVPL